MPNYDMVLIECPPAQYRLGRLYYHGIHNQVVKYVSKDTAKAVMLFRLAADQKYAQAQCHLGLMYYYHRQDLNKVHAEAVTLCRLAAAQGHTSAQNMLGVVLAAHPELAH